MPMTIQLDTEAALPLAGVFLRLSADGCPVLTGRLTGGVEVDPEKLGRLRAIRANVTFAFDGVTVTGLFSGFGEKVRTVRVGGAAAPQARLEVSAVLIPRALLTWFSAAPASDPVPDGAIREPEVLLFQQGRRERGHEFVRRLTGNRLAHPGVSDQLDVRFRWGTCVAHVFGLDNYGFLEQLVALAWTRVPSVWGWTANNSTGTPLRLIEGTNPTALDQHWRTIEGSGDRFARASEPQVLVRPLHARPGPALRAVALAVEVIPGQNNQTVRPGPVSWHARTFFCRAATYKFCADQELGPDTVEVELTDPPRPPRTSPPVERSFTGLFRGWVKQEEALGPAWFVELESRNQAWVVADPGTGEPDPKAPLLAHLLTLTSRPRPTSPKAATYGGVYVTHKAGAEVEFRAGAGDVPAVGGGYQTAHPTLEAADVVVHSNTVAVIASRPGVELKKAMGLHADGTLDSIGLQTKDQKNAVELTGEDGAITSTAAKSMNARVGDGAPELTVVKDRVGVLDNLIVEPTKTAMKNTEVKGRWDVTD